jgi:hypothetical protein
LAKLKFMTQIESEVALLSTAVIDSTGQRPPPRPEPGIPCYACRTSILADLGASLVMAPHLTRPALGLVTLPLIFGMTSFFAVWFSCRQQKRC